MTNRRAHVACVAVASFLAIGGVFSCFPWQPVPARGLPVLASADKEPHAEVSIPNTRQIDFTSRVNGHRYSISVALPFESPPSAGFGVLFVLDGYSYFASATEAARIHSNAPDGLVVVGIGYPDDSAFAQSIIARRGPVPHSYDGLPLSQIAPYLERLYDLTLPARDEDLTTHTLPGTPRLKSENVGGVDDFLKTIETEVKPRVSALVHIDPTRQALFGHSAGGLAVLHALFIEPNAFRTYIIASPSIWWNNKVVLADESTFAAAVNAGRASPRVLVTVGGDEGVAPKRPAKWQVDPAALDALVRQTRMVENGSELVTRLKALHGTSDYEVEDYAVFDKQTHAMAAWPALARAIPFAFSTAR